MFDIIFLSYNESNSNQNWNNLRDRFPHAKRLSGVKGIHRAHKIAATISLSNMFWIVDGDSVILDDFNFEDPDGVWEESTYVYRAKNPVNGLEYGWGGIKLLPRYYTMQLTDTTVDMATSVAPHFTAVEKVASVTMFNTDPFSTWKSAFRECVKLSSKIIDRQIDTETEHRLDTWCTVGADKSYGNYCIQGAIAGREYGITNRNNKDNLRLINNFEWLKYYYENKTTAQ